MRSLLPVVASAALFAPVAERFAKERAGMVQDQMVNRGVKNPDVLRVMRTVPRHEFVPANQRHQAYEDHPLHIGFGATISQPYIVAAMTELLELSSRHRVLEIGTGSGYQAAVLAMLTNSVYSVEIVPELARTADETLQRLGYRNVIVRQGDGYKGWPEHAPFDRIILTAAPPDVPQALIDQLRPGGRLVAPVGNSANQQLLVLEKNAEGRTKRRNVFPVMFVPMVPARN